MIQQIMIFIRLCMIAVLFCAVPVSAQDAPVAVKRVPMMTFQQKVDAVVRMQKDPAVLKATVDQAGDVITASLVIRNDQDRAQAKTLASNFVRLIKRLSLDEDPGKKEIGTGLYTYHIDVSRANKAVLATGIKRAEEEALQWAIDDAGHKTDIAPDEADRVKSEDASPQ